MDFFFYVCHAILHSKYIFNKRFNRLLIFKLNAFQTYNLPFFLLLDSKVMLHQRQ